MVYQICSIFDFSVCLQVSLSQNELNFGDKIQISSTITIKKKKKKKNQSKCGSMFDDTRKSNRREVFAGPGTIKLQRSKIEGT